MAGFVGGIVGTAAGVLAVVVLDANEAIVFPLVPGKVGAMIVAP